MQYDLRIHTSQPIIEPQEPRQTNSLGGSRTTSADRLENTDRRRAGVRCERCRTLDHSVSSITRVLLR